MSSVHYYNTHQTNNSGSHSRVQSFQHSKDERSREVDQPSKVEKFIDKIENNLNTFTTDQFEQLRETIRTKGFGPAQQEATTVFGLKKGTVKIKAGKRAGSGMKESDSSGYTQKKDLIQAQIEGVTLEIDDKKEDQEGLG